MRPSSELVVDRDRREVGQDERVFDGAIAERTTSA